MHGDAGGCLGRCVGVGVKALVGVLSVAGGSGMEDARWMEDLHSSESRCVGLQVCKCVCRMVWGWGCAGEGEGGTHASETRQE